MNALLVGTRASKLARRQTDLFVEALRRVHPELAVKIVPVKTQGDLRLDRPVSELGDKSLFTKELEDALFVGEIDVAVHSGKDLSARLPPGLKIGGVLKRADRADLFCSEKFSALSKLPKRSKVGSGSIRRRAQLLLKRNDLRVEPVRGNVETRLKKLSAGDYDALILAAAGLNRLGLSAAFAERLDPEQFLPAPLQGAIVLECRADWKETTTLLEKLTDRETFLEIKAERALLEQLDAGCFLPLGVHSTVHGRDIKMKAGLFHPDGTKSILYTAESEASDPAGLGRKVAEGLLKSGGAELLEELGSPG